MGWKIWAWSQSRRRVDAALKTVGMYAERLKSPSKLSGGQKQRVAVAGIIAMRPLCIVLDEPTAMLDPSGRREVLDTVKKLNKEEGITILLITHYMDEAVQADRVVVMDDGVIRLEGGKGRRRAEIYHCRTGHEGAAGGSAGLCRTRSFEHC